MARTRTTAARAAAALVAAFLAGVTSGCSATTPGYVAIDAGRAHVQRPQAWSEEVAVESPWQKGFREPGKTTESIELTGDYGQHDSARDAMGELILRAQTGLDAFRVVEGRAITVDGADSAQLVRYEGTQYGVPFTGEWVTAARWPSRQTMAVAWTTPTYDPDIEAQLVATVTMSD